jgi:hypothetical protein
MVMIAAVRRNCRWIDLAGGTVVGACALVSVWLLVLRDDGAGATLRELNRAVAAAEADLFRLATLRDEQRSAIVLERGRLALRGQPPPQPPLEEYFQHLALLAGQIGVELRSQAPLPPRHYPTLSEYRFVCEISASLPAIARLLYAVEHTDFWADVSYFKIDVSRGSGSVDSESRMAQITFSLYTAPMAASDGLQKG